MRGQKELHDLSQDKNILSLFSKQELSLLETRGMTLEGFHFYKEAGIKIQECSKCVFWGNLRTLFQMYGMTSCVPCNFQAKLCSKD